jgi:hypothetical protein
MNDLDYYQDHGFSREEAKNQVAADKASTTLLFMFFTLLFKVFLIFFLFMPGIFCAYLILHGLRSYLGNPAGWTYFWWMVGTVYVLECLVFLLKGWYVSLKEKGSWAWVILWTICFLYCFALPGLMLQVLISDQFRRTPGHTTSSPMIISWVSAVILGWLIYRRYSLSSDTAPIWMMWAYRLGRRIPRPGY